MAIAATALGLLVLLGACGLKGSLVAASPAASAASSAAAASAAYR